MIKNTVKFFSVLLFVCSTTLTYADTDKEQIGSELIGLQAQLENLFQYCPVDENGDLSTDGDEMLRKIGGDLSTAFAITLKEEYQAAESIVFLVQTDVEALHENLKVAANEQILSISMSLATIWERFQPEDDE